MKMTEKHITLKDGREATLASAEPADAAELLQLCKTCCSETPFLMAIPEEWDEWTIEQEEEFLESFIDNPDKIMIVCKVDGRIAGNCMLRRGCSFKVRHRTDIGISIMQEFCSLGIGTALFEAMIEIAKNMEGVTRMELYVLEENTRARNLYKKMGFQEVCKRPEMTCNPDGTLHDDIFMIRPI